MSQTTSNMVTPAATLRAAAVYLGRYGWVQGIYYDLSATVFTPAACLVGAIGMVCYGGPVDAPAHQYDDPGFDDFEAALTYLYEFLGRFGSDPYRFNDSRHQWADNVIAMLNDAARTWDHTFKASGRDLDRVLTEAAGLGDRVAGGAA
jgi:hypothetical protein